MIPSYSSIPPQYVGSSQTFHHDGSGDVVIVVPAIDGSQNMDEMIVGGLPEHSICIETEADIEPASPKTMTESSSKLRLHLETYNFHFKKNSIKNCYIE